jgi:hypothetical protein
MRARFFGLGLVTALSAALLTGCTGGGSDQAPITITSTETLTRSPSPTPSAKPFVPPAPATRAPLPAGAAAPAGTVERLCPYIRSGLNQDPYDGPNAADIEGNRIYRTVVLTTLKPVGCRFYFAYGDNHATAEIHPTTFATATDAYNAMVLTARVDPNAIGVPKFAEGADGIRFKTKFYGPDGATDGAFVFAKGKVLVVVYTEQSDNTQNALSLAQAIVGKF